MGGASLDQGFNKLGCIDPRVVLKNGVLGSMLACACDIRMAESLCRFHSLVPLDLRSVEKRKTRAHHRFSNVLRWQTILDYGIEPAK